MATPDEASQILKDRRDMLAAEVDRLRAENERLRADLRQTTFMFACAIEGLGGGIAIDKATLERVPRDVTVTRQDVDDGIRFEIEEA